MGVSFNDSCRWSESIHKGPSVSHYLRRAGKTHLQKLFKSLANEDIRNDSSIASSLLDQKSSSHLFLLSVMTWNSLYLLTATRRATAAPTVEISSQLCCWCDSDLKAKQKKSKSRSPRANKKIPEAPSSITKYPSPYAAL